MFAEFQHMRLSNGLVTQKSQVDKILDEVGNTSTNKINVGEILLGIESIIATKWSGIRALTARDSTLLLLMAQDKIAEKALQDAAVRYGAE